jgi:4-aminobutyrate aminotransferase
MEQSPTNDLFKRDADLIADALKIRYNPLDVDRAEGCRLYDAAGRAYLDFGAGWSVAHLGYSNERLRRAVAEQLERTTYAGLISNDQPALVLAERLIELMPGTFAKKVWFGPSGSDANEAALRLVLRATGRRRVVSFIGSWHGMTEAGMALSGHPAFSGTSGGGFVTKIPYPNPYRHPFGDGAGPVADRCLGFLEGYLFKTVCPSDDVAAVFVESVQSDGGDIVPPPDFLPKLRNLCDRHGILLVVDDVKVGLGRTGRLFSYEHAGIVADLVILGKSLGGDRRGRGDSGAGDRRRGERPGRPGSGREVCGLVSPYPRRPSGRISPVAITRA